MTECADCRGRVDRTRARIYVFPDGDRAKTLCRRCQTNYPDDRQYQPRNGPTRSTYRITGVEP